MTFTDSLYDEAFLKVASQYKAWLILIQTDEVLYTYI